MRAYIGTSGWNYKHWANDVFYPEGLSQKKWLEFFYQHFDTVEINTSFYRLPERSTFQNWRDATPAGFRFAVKASRFFTHMKRLIDPEKHVDLFLQRAAGLGDKFSVLLFQLPPQSQINVERLENLFAYMKAQDIVPGIRCALEVRHGSWQCEDCYRVLRRYNVSLVLADWKGMKIEAPVTADFVFVRRHGPLETGIGGNYTEESLLEDARRTRAWLKEGRDVYVYFNNDPHGHAVRNALRLKELIRDPKSNAPNSPLKRAS